MRKKYTFVEDITILSKEDFRAHARGGVSYVSIGSRSVSDIATVVLHEFAHAFGGVPDEYIVYDGTEKDNPPTCYEKPPDIWPQEDKKQSIIDHRSQDGVFPLTFARFKGCKVQNLWRPYDVSIMKATWRIGGRYPSFGPIHSEQFNKRFEVFTKGTREGGNSVSTKGNLTIKTELHEDLSMFQGTRGDILQFTLTAENEPVDVESIILKGTSNTQALKSVLNVDSFTLQGRKEDIAIREMKYDTTHNMVTMVFLPLTIYPEEPISFKVSADVSESGETADREYFFSFTIHGIGRDTTTALASNSLSKKFNIHPSFSFFARTVGGDPAQHISVAEGDPVKLEWDASVLKKLSGFNWCGRPAEPASEEWKWNDFITSQQGEEKIKGTRSVTPLISTLFTLKCKILGREVSKDVRVDVWSKPSIEYVKVAYKDTEVNGKDISDTDIASSKVPLNSKVSLSWSASKTQKCILETSFLEKNGWVPWPEKTLASIDGIIKGERKDEKVSKSTQYVFRCVLNTKNGEQAVSHRVRINVVTPPKRRGPCPEGYAIITPAKPGGRIICYGL